MYDIEQANTRETDAILLGPSERLCRCASESSHTSLVEDHSWASTLQAFLDYSHDQACICVKNILWQIDVERHEHGWSLSLRPQR